MLSLERRHRLAHPVRMMLIGIGNNLDRVIGDVTDRKERRTAEMP